MISDEERREVASRLRYEESADPGCLNMIGEWYLISFLQSIDRAVDNGTEYHLRERLADLIDRPTCFDTESKDSKSFTCSACGFSESKLVISPFTLSFLWVKPSYRFCPNCGAEVIPDAERRD